MIKKLTSLSALSLLFLSFTVHSQDFPFTQRKTWDGPYDIKMIAAPNLEPVYLDSTNAVNSILKADSVIRYSTIAMSGDLMHINNNFKGGSPFKQLSIPLQALLCKDPNGACLEGLTLNKPNSTCAIRYNSPTTVKKYVSMNYADYDNDMSTFSSSMAKLDISKCSEIEAAYLYWSGNFKTTNRDITLATPTSSYNGTGDVFSVSTTSGFDSILLKTPGNKYQNVKAITKYESATTYVCVSDVTTLINGTSGGDFWVGNIQSYPNENNGGSTSGWSLVIIFRSPLSPPRLISLWDGFKNVQKNQSENFVLTGLQAPATSDFQSFVGFSALDGENLAIELKNSTREGLGFQTNANGAPFSVNPFASDQPAYKLWNKKGYPALSDGSDNLDPDGCKIPQFDANWASVFDGVSSSHITSYDPFKKSNGNEIIRLPSHKNTLGYDAHHMKLPDGAVAPGATEATLTVNAGPQGSTMPFLAYLAIERLQPKLVLTKWANKASTGLDSTITYTLRVKNEGNDTSLVGDVVYDTLDVATDYVFSSMLASKGSVMLTDSVNNQLKMSIQSRILPKDSVDITFTVKVKDYASNLNLWNTQCKRSVTNSAFVEYATKTTAKIKSKSNSIECGPSSETKIILVDAKFKAVPDSLGTFDATLYRNESIEKHVRQELFKSGKVSAIDTNKFEVRDSTFKLVNAATFPLNGKLVSYFAIRNNNSTGDCQKIYKLIFILGIPKIHVDTIRIANLCAGYTISNPILTAGDTSSYGSKLVNSNAQEVTIATKQGGSLNIDPISNSYIYSPKAGFVGKDTAVIQLFEPVRSITVEKPIYVTVNPVNYAPKVKRDFFSTYRNQSITSLNVLSNDKDADGMALLPASEDGNFKSKSFKIYKNKSDSTSSALVSYTKLIDSIRVKPKHGTLSINVKGEFTYEPNLDDAKDKTVKDTAIFWVCDFSQKTYCNPFFCRLDTVVFEIKPYEIFVPDGFSPNNDGTNDLFVIDAEVPLKIQIAVYSRNGNLVYENKDYKNNWDGTANRGVVMGDGLPDGTYYVYFKITDKVDEQESFKYITINR